VARLDGPRGPEEIEGTVKGGDLLSTLNQDRARSVLEILPVLQLEDPQSIDQGENLRQRGVDPESSQGSAEEHEIVQELAFVMRS